MRFWASEDVSKESRGLYPPMALPEELWRRESDLIVHSQRNIYEPSE